MNAVAATNLERAAHRVNYPRMVQRKLLHVSRHDLVNLPIFVPLASQSASQLLCYFQLVSVREQIAPVNEPAMARIPAGWFEMGHASGLDCERPVHRVWVDGFELACCQVTNADYERFLRARPLAPPPFWSDPNFHDPHQPVVAVSWFEAEQYCQWLSEVTGCRYRLPTEAEWERAARGGVEGWLFPWGDGPPQSLPDYTQRWRTGPEPVARYAPNAYGLFNMCDNVHEWCSDWFDPGYYQLSPERNPRGPAQGARKASRGGSWRHHIKVSRCHTRSSIPPAFQYADYGFRVARDSVRAGE